MRFIIDVVATGEEAHEIRREKKPENLGTNVASRYFLIRGQDGGLDLASLDLAALKDVPEYAVLTVTPLPT